MCKFTHFEIDVHAPSDENGTNRNIAKVPM